MWGHEPQTTGTTATSAARGPRILKGLHVVLDGHQAVWDGHGRLEGGDLGDRVLQGTRGEKTEPSNPEEKAPKGLNIMLKSQEQHETHMW